ncbi:hypothetical protein T02_11272, partial [Trichinella nativa]
LETSRQQLLQKNRQSASETTDYATFPKNATAKNKSRKLYPSLGHQDTSNETLGPVLQPEFFQHS